MGASLSSPVELVRVQRSSNDAIGIKCAVAECQGWRNHHEDAHLMKLQPDSASLWVLDGHGGDQAALIGAPALGDEIKVKDGGLPTDPAIADGFSRADNKVRIGLGGGGSGSTVVGSVICKKKGSSDYCLKLCNAGDSRAVLVHGPNEEKTTAAVVKVKKPQPLIDHEGDVDEDPEWPMICETEDHKPSHPIEKSRIEAAGGMVTNDEVPRVDGNLAVSRGLGDFEYKGNKLKCEKEQKVTCDPHIYLVPSVKEGSILVLACDGVWDVVSSEEIAAFVHDEIKKDTKLDLGDLAAEIISMCLAKDSRDNITVMIAHLGVEATAKDKEKEEQGDELKAFNTWKGHLETKSHMEDDVVKAYRTFLQKTGFDFDPMSCEACKRWFMNTKECPCKEVYYCNKKCQKAAWKGGHKNDCKAIKH